MGTNGNKLIIHIDKFNEMRRSIAKLYDQNLKIDTFVKTKNYCENSLIFSKL